jgi:ATP-binding cassette subfamily C protein
VLKNGIVAATGSFSELMSGDDTFKGIIESYLSSANEIGRKKME